MPTRRTTVSRLLHATTSAAVFGVTALLTTAASGAVPAQHLAATTAQTVQPGTYRPYSSSMPGVLGATTIGYSLEHRPIVAYRMGDPTSRVKGIILGQMHGEEHAGVIVTNKILQGPPVHGMDLWVIQTINPDGDRVHRRQNDHGVDLNRNFPNHWTHLTGEHYSGPSPLSEPESRAMYNFLRKIRPNLMVSIHQPLDGIDTTDGGARNPAFRDRLAHNLGLPERAFVCNDVCHGSMTGWITHYQAGSAITVEFPYSPGSYKLTTVAPRGILYAMNMRYGWSARHNPAMHVDAARGTSTAKASSVTISGWGIDPDLTSGRLAVRVTGGSSHYAVTTVQRDDVNRAKHVSGTHGFSLMFASTPGRHSFCVRVSNVGPGTGASMRCVRVTVPAEGTRDSRPVNHL